jgi:hypothetical protein
VDQPKKLYAPGYYLAVDAARDYEGAIRVRGASNLPAGAKIQLDVEGATGEDGWKTLSAPVCVAVDQGGLFDAELSVTKETYKGQALFVNAVFLTNECSQDQRVLQVVGRHGEFLGNDTYHVTMNEVEMGLTPGMAKNPQLFQVSGWYFGISAITRVG